MLEGKQTVRLLAVLAGVCACGPKQAAESPRRGCLADEACVQRTILDCPPGLQPRSLFDLEPEHDLGPTVVVARLEAGAIVTRLIECPPNVCCVTGHGAIGLTSELSVGDANFLGTAHASLGGDDEKASIDITLADGTAPECRADPTGKCCTYDQAAFGDIYIVRGKLVSATQIEEAELCRPRKEDYPNLRLATTAAADDGPR